MFFNYHINFLWYPSHSFLDHSRGIYMVFLTCSQLLRWRTFQSSSTFQSHFPLLSTSMCQSVNFKNMDIIFDKRKGICPTTSSSFTTATAYSSCSFFSSVIQEYLLPRTGSQFCLKAWNTRMYELKENKPLHIEIGIAFEIFNKNNSKTSMIANLVTVFREWKW